MREDEHPNIKKTLEQLEKQSPFQHVADDKAQKRPVITNDSPNQEDSKFEDELNSSKSLSPL